MEALENKKSNYNSIFKGILKQHINKRRRKKKTAESRMKERGSGLKTTSNEFMESVLGIISPMLQEAGITTNLEREVRDYVNTFMYPEEYTLTESITASCSIGERDSHSSTSGDEELDDSGDEDECQ